MSAKNILLPPIHGRWIIRLNMTAKLHGDNCHPQWRENPYLHLLAGDSEQHRRRLT
jgi:hypothetical protein